MSEMLKIAAVGDLSFNGAYSQLDATARTRIFAGIQRLLVADLLIGNLEAPLTAKTERVSSWRHSLRAEPTYAEVLNAAGFHAVCLANNHTMDYGWEALRECMTHLDRAGILYFGAGQDLQQARKPVVIEIRGRKIALLGYCDVPVGIPLYASETDPGVAPFDLPAVRHDIAAAKLIADHVIVNMHWGMEYTHLPQPDQRRIAAAIIEAGGTLVIGHHSHSLQGAERFGNGAVFYSLGNFVFADGPWAGVNPAGEPFTDVFKMPDACRVTGIAQAWLGAKDVERISMIPVRLQEDRTLQPDSTRAEADQTVLAAPISSPFYRIKWATELLRVRTRALTSQMLGEHSPWQALTKVRPRHFKGLFRAVKNEARQFKGAKQA